MNGNGGNVSRLHSRGSSGNSNGGDRSGGGFRLDELERRVGALEQETGETKGICIELKAKLENLSTKEHYTELKTRMEGLATKEDVLQAKNDMLKWGVGIIVVMLLSVVGHVFLRSL